MELQALPYESFFLSHGAQHHSGDNLKLISRGLCLKLIDVELKIPHSLEAPLLHTVTSKWISKKLVINFSNKSSTVISMSNLICFKYRG